MVALSLLPLGDASEAYVDFGCMAVPSAPECFMRLARRGEDASVSGLFLEDWLTVILSLRKL